MLVSLIGTISGTILISTASFLMVI